VSSPVSEFLKHVSCFYTERISTRGQTKLIFVQDDCGHAHLSYPHEEFSRTRVHLLPLPYYSPQVTGRCALGPRHEVIASKKASSALGVDHGSGKPGRYLHVGEMIFFEKKATGCRSPSGACRESTSLLWVVVWPTHELIRIKAVHGLKDSKNFLILRSAWPTYPANCWRSRISAAEVTCFAHVALFQVNVGETSDWRLECFRSSNQHSWWKSKILCSCAGNFGM
jgi:hypothetical protein